MCNIQPTHEQIKQAKNNIYYRQAPYIAELTRIISLKSVQILVSSDGITFDYGEETQAEKDIKEVLNYIAESEYKRINMDYKPVN